MTIIGEIFIVLGSFFIFLSAIGMLKMPDYLMKLQVSSKASAFGIFLVLIGGNLISSDLNLLAFSIMILIFLLITTPIAAHALANAHKKVKK